MTQYGLERVFLKIFFLIFFQRACFLNYSPCGMLCFIPDLSPSLLFVFLLYTQVGVL
jgi:hypothetical protein